MKELLGKDELSGRLWTGFLVDRSMGKNLGRDFSNFQLSHKVMQCNTDGFATKRLLIN